ncbi:hypothetical protein BIW11_03294 [Tropilaelaps mercedesae]|uniref:Uncharacterized protein n=1 Tax=Tropilaelaps mercedesae TaxID=418985 RepID=A0A1V9XNW2_9ACAR|nr:hypothetical protein BIW11_03294 [Tropilaelaps mercedesae]
MKHFVVSGDRSCVRFNQTGFRPLCYRVAWAGLSEMFGPFVICLDVG